MDEHELHPRISHTAHECGLLPLMVDAGADSSPMIRAAVLFCEREGASDVSEVRFTEPRPLRVPMQISVRTQSCSEQGREARVRCARRSEHTD